MSDTVGFIRKLPPTVIDAFRATLEELAEATIILHVVDLSAKNAAEQCQVVEDILNDLSISDKPRITALNKIDLLLEFSSDWDEDEATNYLTRMAGGAEKYMAMISAKKGWGLKKLMETINHAVNLSNNPVIEKHLKNEAL